MAKKIWAFLGYLAALLSGCCGLLALAFSIGPDGGLTVFITGLIFLSGSLLCLLGAGWLWHGRKH